MRNKMIVIIGAVVVLFGALYFVVEYKDNKALNESDNPYGDKRLDRATIAQLDDPLYQNIILAEDLKKDLDANEDVTVYFYSPTCSYCKEVTPVLVPLTEELDIDMKKVNLLEEDRGTGKSMFDVTGTPTLVHYENGEEVARVSGSQPEEVFKSFLKEHVVE